jgi:hypothetical protein
MKPVSKDAAISEANNANGSSYGFIVVCRMKRHEVAVSTPPVNPKQSKKTQDPYDWVKTFFISRSKRVKTELLFVSCFSPNISSRVIEESVNERLRLSSLVCIKLKTKYNTYAYFHTSVHEDVFPLINNTGVCPQGALIAPFYGKISANQINSSETCTAFLSALSRPSEEALRHQIDGEGL